MPKRRFNFWSIPIVLPLILGIVSLLNAWEKTGSGWDNTTTTGTVIAVGPSSVGSGPFAITYAFDVPGFPRNGNAGSFTREQITTKKQLARFKSGQTIIVERSKLVPGASRIQGFGRGSVIVRELF